jgi:predicted ATP-grasp superfamily ATP-dependent carboligase
MRILVHEFASGGGLAGRRVPASLGREGAAMRDALVADLAVMRRHRIVTTVDPRFPLRAPPGVEVVTLPRGSAALLDRLFASADAVWLVAPETDGCLERLASRVEDKGTALLGPGAAAIRRAADKAGLPRRLARQGVPHPKTRVLRVGVDWLAAAREVGYPVVVKPARGAGCQGVCLARDARELRQAVDMAGRAAGKRPLLLQRYVPGVAASVSLLADGRRAVALTVNAQRMRASRPFAYRGGTTPLDHPLAGRAVEAALGACRALPGLRGYVGVDVVLTRSEAVVIEVNPRLTTSYLGVRRALEGNVAALTLAACAGALPAPPPIRRHVRYTAGGRIVSVAPPSSSVLPRS